MNCIDLFAHQGVSTSHPIETFDDVVAPPFDVTPYLAASHYAGQLSLLSLLRQREPARSRSVTDVVAVDLFAGGGGASLGIEQATDKSPIVAVNHDWHAIQMHMANHPLSIHFHRDVWEVPPRGAVNGAKIDLLWASPDCFPAGTMILTSDGYKAVEAVTEGMLVLTHQNRWRRVTATMRAMKPVREIRGYGHPGLRVSSEHPFWTISMEANQAPTWRTAGELRKGDYWSTPTSFQPLPVPDVAGRGMPLDARLWWLAGRYLADGWSRLTEDRSELVICCGKTKVESTRSMLNCWPRHGDRAEAGELAWYERKTDENAIQFSTSHRGLVVWLREHFGHRAEHKRIPGWAYGLSEGDRRALLAGYLSGDGWKGATVEVNTISKALAFGVRSLAASLGYVPTVYLRKKNTDTIQGRKVNALPCWSVRWRESVNPAHRQHRNVDSHLFTPIRAVTDDPCPVPVYNLSVEEDESYIADGIVVHNCTHHSRARGGKPRQKDIRALAWVIVEWAFEVRPTVIAGENVPEFLGWGPLHPDVPSVPEKLRNRPIRERMGETFDAFRLALGPGVPEDHPSWGEIPERVREYARRGCGYELRTAILNAADHDTPTSRSRLYFVARCDGEPIRFPEPTCGPGRAKPWRTAAECLDFEEPSLSIFASPEEARAWAKSRKTGIPQRPLAEATMRRIAEGIRRFVLTNADPYIVVTGHQSSDGGKVKPVSGPLSTIVTKAEHCLVTPVLTKFYGTSKAGATVEEPMPTVTAQAGGGPLGMAVAVLAPAEMSTPLVMRAHGKGWDKPGNASGVTKPGEGFPTITATEEWSVITPILVQSGYGEREGQAPRALDITKPLGTVVGAGCKHALVSAFMAKHYGGVVGHGLDRALGTVTGIDHHSLVEADLSPTLAQPDRREMVTAFLVKYYGEGGQWQSLDEPLHTVVSVARFGLIEVVLQRYVVGGKTLFHGVKIDDCMCVAMVLNGVIWIVTDIRMRMLAPRELARAQGFPDSYILTGTKAQQIARIGNSVCPPMARAIVEANFGPRAPTVAAA